MKPRVKTALGIDIGSRHISAALVERTEGGFRVVASAGGELPTDAVNQTPPAPEKVLSQVLRKLGRAARARGTRVAVAASTPSALMRLLDLPRQMPANLGDFVDSELKQYVALSGRQVTSDFCGIGVGSGMRKRLLAVAADAEEIRDALRVCGAAGATVDSVEPAALAHVRGVLADAGERKRYSHALVATLDGGSLAACVVRKGMLDFVRIRDVPPDANSPQALCAWLTEELNAVLRYYRSESSGEGAEWRAHLMIRDVACSRDEIRPLLAFEPEVKGLEVVDFAAPVEREAGADTGLCVAAVGAAVKALDPDGDAWQIDLTPRELIQARSSSRQVWIAANLAAAVFIVFFLAVQLLARTNEARSRRIEQTRIAEELAATSALVQEDRYLDGEIARMQEQLSGLKALRGRRAADWPAMLEAIWQAKPTEACVGRILCEDGRTVVVQGTASSSERIKAFVQSLDGPGPFESVWLSHVQRPQEDGTAVSFEINCAVRGTN